MREDEGESNTKTWTAHYHEDGSIYYYNTVTEETSWDPPADGDFEPPKEKEEEALAWSAAKSDDGEIYYHNTITDETSWEPPPEGFNPLPEEEENETAATKPVQEEDVPDVSAVKSQEPHTLDSPDVAKSPENPKDNGDEDSVLPSPTIDPKEEEESDSGAAAGSDPAPEHQENEQTHVWSAFYDDSGQIYYFNADTQESVWEAPEEGFNPPPPVSKWTAYTDEEGREYYCNAVTGETQWEKPDDYEPPAEAPSAALTSEEAASDAALEEPLQDAEVPQPEPEPRSPSPPPIDPKVAALNAAEEALAKPDSVLEPTVISHLSEMADANKLSAAVGALVKSYQGQTAVCGLLAKWTTTLQGPEAADAIRTTASNVIHKAAKEGFTKEAADAIINLNKSEAAFLQDMMDSSRWRRLLIELTAQHKDSAVLLYCLKRISAKGHHREIAQLMDQSEHFAVFNAMLSSELSVVGGQAVSSGSDISAAIAFPDLVTDLCRSCGATSFTYLYSRKLLQTLESMALQEVEDDKEPERFLRAIEKWRGIAESLEMSMVDPNITGSSALIRKRRIETALMFSDLRQKRQRTNKNSVESALLTLLEKHAAGIQPAEALLEGLLPSGLDTDTKGVGSLLLKYPIAVRALLTPLFKSGRTGNASPSLKNKCARLIALAALAADTTNQGEIEEGETKDEIGFQRMISEASQLCEHLETMISFLVDIDEKAPITSPGQKLYAIALKCPPVGIGAMLWAKDFTRGRDYAASASFPTLSPSVLSLVRLVAVKFPFTRSDALEIALTFLRHANPDINYQRANAIKECSLRLALVLLINGETVPVLTSLIKMLAGNSDLDASLIRYFVIGALEVVRPPVSPVFVRLFGKLLLIGRVSDAIRTNYVNAENRKLLANLIEAFCEVRLHDGSELPKDDLTLLQTLQETYKIQDP